MLYKSASLSFRQLCSSNTSFSTVSALNWNLREILKTAICTIFQFAFDVTNATENYATNDKHIYP